MDPGVFKQNLERQNLKVNLDYNNVTYIDLKNVDKYRIEHLRFHVSISIQNNPIRCNCKLYDFLLYLEGRLHAKVKETLELLIGKSKCHGPREYRDIVITDLRSQTLQCNVNEEDLGIECPNKCVCYMRPENNTFIVDCGFKGLMEAPRKIDCPPHHHFELILTGNYLTKMPNLDQNGYNNVTTLALDHNNISSITVDGLSNKLKVKKIKPLQVFKNLCHSIIL